MFNFNLFIYLFIYFIVPHSLLAGSMSVSVMDAMAASQRALSFASPIAPPAAVEKVNRDSFELLRVIGQGGYGKVCRVWLWYLS